MNNTMKWLLMILMVVYCISPVDALPGPVDDIIVMILTMMARKKVEVG